MPKAIKTIRSHAGYARFLYECDLDDQGDTLVVREVARQADIPSPYHYAPIWPVFRWNNREIIVRETSHRCFQVFDAPPARPIHEHDCKSCVYLGQHNPDGDVHDLYFCNKINPTVIARWGNNGPDYTSGLGSAHPSLIQAERLAREKGLIG